MNLRKDNKGKALEAWKKLGVGHIAKPLRHIRERCAERDSEGRVTYKHPYPLAEYYARIGNGAGVQEIALLMGSNRGNR